MPKENKNIAEAEEKLEENIVVDENQSNTDNDFDFFAGSNHPREGFEDEEEEEEEEKSEESQNTQPTISQTDKEDEQYFKMAVSFIDNNRAIGLSLYMTGNLDNVDQFVYYNNWDDPKHKALLEAGGVVAKKYKFSAFKFLPEFMIIMALIVSTTILFKQAKKEKIELSKKATQGTNSKTDTKIRPLGPIEKVG